MYVTRVSTRLPLSKQSATHLSKAVAGFSQCHGVSTNTTILRLTGAQIQSRRQFSSTPRTQLRDVFPAPEHDHNIKKTDPAWPHPPYEYLKSIQSLVEANPLLAGSTPKR
jgi:hypothetical protein